MKNKKQMKVIPLALLFIIMTSMPGQAQETKDSLKQPEDIPKTFFNYENYSVSNNYAAVCLPHLWLSLYGEYDRHKTSIGDWRFGNKLKFDSESRFSINKKMYGDYKLDSVNGLLYMRWDKSNDSIFSQGIVCKINYCVAKKNKTIYQETLQVYRYIGANWNMPVENILKCKTELFFEPLVRSKGIFDFLELR